MAGKPVTRHPTTQDLRQALAAICATPEQRQLVDEAFGAKRGRIREERETEPRVPIIGLDAGCVPGTNPGSSARRLELDEAHLAKTRRMRNQKDQR